MSFPPYITFEPITPSQDIHLFSFSKDTEENIRTLNYIMNLFTIEGGVPQRNNDPMQIMGPIFFYDSIDHEINTDLEFNPPLYGRTVTNFDFENISSNTLNVVLGNDENEFTSIVKNKIIDTGSYSINLLTNTTLTNQGNWYDSDKVDQYVSLIIDESGNMGIVGNPETLLTKDDVNNVLLNDRTYDDISILANYKFDAVGGSITSIEYLERIEDNSLWTIDVYSYDILNDEFRGTIDLPEISGIYLNWNSNNKFEIRKHIKSLFPTIYGIYFQNLILSINGMYTVINNNSPVHIDIDNPTYMITDQTNWILNETANQFCALVAHFNKEYLDNNYSSSDYKGVEIGIIGDIENLNDVSGINDVLEGRNFEDIIILSVIEFETDNNTDIIDIKFHKKLEDSELWQVREFPHWRNILADGGDLETI